MNSRGQLLAFVFTFLATTAVYAAVPVHWAVQGYYLEEGNGYVQGAFDYYPDSNSFYNITLQSFWEDENYSGLYHDYANANAFYTPGTGDSVDFFDEYFIDGAEPTEVNTFLSFTNFDPSQFGTVYFHQYEFGESTHYSTANWGFTRERPGLVAIASGAPIPEPETYAMMLAGLGMLGVTAKQRKKTSTA